MSMYVDIKTCMQIFTGVLFTIKVKKALKSMTISRSCKTNKQTKTKESKKKTEMNEINTLWRKSKPKLVP